MVTYLKVDLESVKQLIERVDVVVVPAAQRPHDLPRILVRISSAKLPLDGFLNQGILSRSFSLVSWGGGFLEGEFLCLTLRQRRVAGKSDNAQVGGLERPAHEGDGSAGGGGRRGSTSSATANRRPQGQPRPGSRRLATERKAGNVDG